MREKKRILCACLALLMLFTLIPFGAFAASSPVGAPAFTDVENHWATDAITFMSTRNLMRGTSQTTFGPDAIFTRAQAATLLYRIAEEPTVTGTASFRDVAPGAWYDAAVTWAYQRNIAQGVGGGRFAPNAPVTREQMATLLHRFAAYQGQDMAVPPGFRLDFPDANQVSPWAESAMRWVAYNELVQGMSQGALLPHGTATRAQAATVVMRLVELLDQNAKSACCDLEFKNPEICIICDVRDCRHASPELFPGFTVMLDSMGGTVTPNTMVANMPQRNNPRLFTLNSALPIPTRTGYIFTGWHRSNGQLFSNFVDVTGQGRHGFFIGSDFTLYADWVAAENQEIFTVKLDANGGVLNVFGGGTTTATVTTGIGGRLVRGTVPEPLRIGYTFAGWYTEKDGGTRIDIHYNTPIRGTEITKNTTLYARWNPVMITFDPNGGTVKVEQLQVCVFCGALNYLPIPIRDGFNFEGWYTVNLFDNERILTGRVMERRNTSIRARWTSAAPGTFTITLCTIGTNASITPTNIATRVDGRLAYLPAPSYPSWERFLGWFDSDWNQITMDTVFTGDTTIRAHFALPPG